ncbi:hypothetical protein [Paenibacillus protaetiae]|uniref:Uncharacterized protein n=1 Tax=Paenibacillus protaetiae TaxID=2509456 RepID=A0A4P6EX45_9BACL|nr:hypothetical protein [Paenibacillus protaetiae]QAY66309.1 hypothetical protein ET464_07740 [Paenibacillus protaetiae]
MEHDKQYDKQGKRSAALPITLALLVFSLIGNVFLYAQSIQNSQDRKYEAGQVVGMNAEQTASFYNSALQSLDSLLQNDGSGTGQMMIDKFNLGQSFGNHVQGVLDFITAAHKLEGKDDKVDAVFQIFSDNEQKLRLIAMENGSLSDADRNYLTALRDAYAQEREIILRFNFDTIGIRSSSIRLGGGYGWLDIADDLEKAILVHGSSLK